MQNIFIFFSPWNLDLTRSLPSEGHGVCLRPGRHPQRENADQDAPEISEQMSCVCHDGQTVSGVATCRVEQNIWTLTPRCER